MAYLKKGAFMTDIHFGRRNNADQHNQDCLDYIKWFCDNVKADPSIDYVAFLGDWHQSRPAIGVSTLMYSYIGAKMLNDLGLPIYFVVGNHDLYNRNSRDIHSVLHFSEFPNFKVIDKPIIVEEIKDKVFFSPYLFHEEYDQLGEFLNIPVWAGHFEFKGFVITGNTTVMKDGPNPDAFAGPKYIFSGHFHKRQKGGNIIYIGNTFPMDFSDVNDDQRGMMIYDHVKHQPKFYNWEDSPKYLRCNISDLLDGKFVASSKARLDVIYDVPMNYEESVVLRETYTSQFQLREFISSDGAGVKEAITDTEAAAPENIESIDQAFERMIKEVSLDKIDPDYLIELYREIKI